MTSREIVRRAIEFDGPPRLPFFQHQVADVPDDVCDTWEMDRAQSGWFFDHCADDDWGCGWHVTEQKNMGQVERHPLADWSRLDTYRPPNPRNPYYFERLGPALDAAGDRYVVVTCHFNLIERLHMLHGFTNTLADFHLAPEKIERALDMILEFKVELFAELARRFGDRVDGLFLTDDWGTQERTFISPPLFEHFFLERYRKLMDAVHSHGWHAILHSCGRVNDFVPYFIRAGADVLNLQQPRAYGIAELGRRFAGKVCFLTTADVQTTLPQGDPERVRAEVRELVEEWATPQGGFIVFNYGDPASLAIKPEMTEVMFHAFAELMHRWS
ncbi:MAG: uroporphyrinogen decarboxylase family protein [Candidatus Latescibacterota bacterium]